MTLDAEPVLMDSPAGLGGGRGLEDLECETDVAAPFGSHTYATAAGQLWDDAIVRHLRGQPGVLRTLEPRGGSAVVPVPRWCAPADAVDTSALLRFMRLLGPVPGTAPVLDLGCGPGRHVEMLAGWGVPVLGVDVSPTCVALTRAAGAPARLIDGLHLLRAAPGRWSGVLLMDGNVGVGGDADVLLSSVRHALTPDGLLLVELDVLGVTDDQPLRLASDDRTSEAFAWSRLSARDLPVRARRAGLILCDLWAEAGRTFAVLAPSRSGGVCAAAMPAPR